MSCSLIKSNYFQFIARAFSRQCFLHYYKLGHNAGEAERKMCQSIGKDAVSTNTACRWFERFRNGDFSLEGEQLSKSL